MALHDSFIFLKALFFEERCTLGSASPSAFDGMVTLSELQRVPTPLSSLILFSGCAFSAFDRFTTGGFTSNYKPTVGLDFSQTNVMVGEQRLRVTLWQVL